MNSTMCSIVCASVSRRARGLRRAGHWLAEASLFPLRCVGMELESGAQQGSLSCPAQDKGGPCGAHVMAHEQDLSVLPVSVHPEYHHVHRLLTRRTYEM